MSTRPRIVGVIPARYASSRFPGKPLTSILGRPMFAHVFERASLCPLIDEVVLATDDRRIMDAAQELGVPAVMTDPSHASGTDRVHEAAGAMGLGMDDVIINIQGDEPALRPEMLCELAEPFRDDGVMVTTLAQAIAPGEAANPDRVKVVFTREGTALYFSRSPIPYPRNGEPAYYGHIGLYGFKRRALEAFVLLPPSRLELMEGLEQLRLLEARLSMRVVVTEYASVGVDRPEDVAVVEKLLSE
jgi:3-deoxy-manno-octulosonate cytidylyltransferase (CMP-KDO synthetase)